MERFIIYFFIYINKKYILNLKKLIKIKLFIYNICLILNQQSKRKKGKNKLKKNIEIDRYLFIYIK